MEKRQKKGCSAILPQNSNRKMNRELTLGEPSRIGANGSILAPDRKHFVQKPAGEVNPIEVAR